MRTSLNEIAEIEGYIFGKLPAGRKILMDARMLIYPSLRMKVFLQKKIYRLLYLYHKKELKKQAEDIFESLMMKPSFQKEISVIFKQKTDD